MVSNKQFPRPTILYTKKKSELKSVNYHNIYREKNPLWYVAIPSRDPSSRDYRRIKEYMANTIQVYTGGVKNEHLQQLKALAQHRYDEARADLLSQTKQREEEKEIKRQKREKKLKELEEELKKQKMKKKELFLKLKERNSQGTPNRRPNSSVSTPGTPAIPAAQPRFLPQDPRRGSQEYPMPFYPQQSQNSFSPYPPGGNTHRSPHGYYQSYHPPPQHHFPPQHQMDPHHHQTQHREHPQGQQYPPDYRYRHR